MPIWPFKTRKPVPPSGPSNDNPPDAHCSFCYRPRKHVGPMVEGPNDVYICVDCVRLANQIAEANAMQPATTDLNDPGVQRAGHMHIRCYFRLLKDPDGQWTAVSEHQSGLAGAGPSAKDSLRDLQSKVLAATAEAFAQTKPVGTHFTNHADPRLR